MATFSTFGAPEKLIAADLLKAWANGEWASQDDHLEDDATVEFNQSSGYVFLVDDDYSVAMLNDQGKLENWLSCGDCGAEGFRNEVNFADESLCRECARKEAEGASDERDSTSATTDVDDDGTA